MTAHVAESGWVTQRSGRMGDWPRWYMAWWPWAAVLYHRDWTFSLGVHVQPTGGDPSHEAGGTVRNPYRGDNGGRRDRVPDWHLASSL